jgi:flagellar motility protein MotE (MotC chaperone)
VNPDTLAAAAELADDLTRRHPGIAAAELEALPTDEVVRFLSSTSPEVAAALIEKMRPEVACEIILHADVRLAGSWLSGANPARAAVIVSRLDESDRARVLSTIDATTAGELFSTSERRCLQNRRSPSCGDFVT